MHKMASIKIPVVHLIQPDEVKLKLQSQNEAVKLQNKSLLVLKNNYASCKGPASDGVDTVI